MPEDRPDLRPSTSTPQPDGAVGARLDRRTVLRGVGAIGVVSVAGGVLVACGGDDPDAGTSTEPPEQAEPTEPETSSTGSEEPVAGIAATSDVPVGGGVILEDPEAIVITQPAEGEFKAFNAICTHQQCPVGSVEDNVIRCPCHGSTFDAATGENLGGPAPAPLEEIAIGVEGDQIVLR